MRKALAIILVMSMVFCLYGCGGSDTVPQEKIDISFSVIDATAGANSNEEAGNLFDLDAQTKWCVVNFQGASVTFEASEAIKISGYSFVTANDCETFTGRNPISWDLSGSNNNEDWEIIDTKSNNSTIPDKNKVKCDFNVSADKEYKYYKLLVYATSSGNCMQVSEFSLHYDGADYEYMNMPTDSGSNNAETNANNGTGNSGNSNSTPANKNLGQQTIYDGATYTFQVGEYITFKNPAVPGGSIYAYSWFANEGGDCVTLSKNGAFCTITGAKPGKCVMQANLDYNSNGSNHEYVYIFTINITEATPGGSGSSNSSGSSNNSSSSSGSSSYNPDIYNNNSNSTCRYCGGKGYTICTTCDGKGYYYVSGSVPNYSGKPGGGGSYREKKDCPSFSCNNGRKDCTHC